mmetsp:Transcript_5339/g.13431  ORF Transcript_5339/g.13431 Transcript_5339/m.13431 type:complete len:165 (+) Transcript_5339:117-611(+)|eukprot:CAMPEP_0177649950 /NCGR_PEP_ID=MMETSP0447-20121125/11670_1 /TAXON_ID=0 /ORGANISM="Stygamoeba regulata, Strain BSH-02190019" /LENGTH=164 /DNA_ID=CAMNT_0019152763 /DNA_START=115 /DNA_END=609 /DNA_ORIENTATION=-
MFAELINPNPTVYDVSTTPLVSRQRREAEMDDSVPDPIDSLEVFETIRTINDPEHPLTLEQLKVVDLSLVSVDDANSHIDIRFTPTVPHCSAATLIGLCIRVKLLRSLPARFKVDIAVSPGSHSSEEQVNKQLNDKERVAAALENPQLLSVVHGCIQGKAAMAS